MEPIPLMELYIPASPTQIDSTAPALSRGLAFVEALDVAPKGLTLTQLSDAIDSPKNSTLRPIQALVDQGWAVRDPATLKVRLTSKVLRLGQPRNGDHSLTECVLPVMRELRDQCGESVQLGILIGSELVINAPRQCSPPLHSYAKRNSLSF